MVRTYLPPPPKEIDAVTHSRSSADDPLMLCKLVALCTRAGMTALLSAVESDHSDCVRELLYAGASPDGRTTIRLDDGTTSPEDCQSSWQGPSEMVT